VVRPPGASPILSPESCGSARRARGPGCSIADQSRIENGAGARKISNRSWPLRQHLARAWRGHRSNTICVSARPSPPHPSPSMFVTSSSFHVKEGGAPLPESGPPLEPEQISLTSTAAPCRQPGELAHRAPSAAAPTSPASASPPMEPVGILPHVSWSKWKAPRATLAAVLLHRVADGMVVDTTSEKARGAGRVLDSPANHRIDCRSRQGGGVPLQDRPGPRPRREPFIEEKPTREADAIRSGVLDRERCIQCARCTVAARGPPVKAQIDFAGRGRERGVGHIPTEPSPRTSANRCRSARSVR